MSNLSDNKRAIDAFRKELIAMLSDISEIDARILNKAVNTGLANAKRNTPIGQYSGGKVGGFMRKSWKATPIIKSAKGVEKALTNSADYSSFVNDGHRLVNKAGETIGWVKGQYMLENAIHETEKNMIKEFKTEIERVNREHDR